MKVSVIVTTKNEEANISSCLQSLVRQSIGNLEIIVVDNNSTDKTKEIARQFTKNVYNLGPERSAQRNFGVEKAQGEYILYLDADMILADRAVEMCLASVASNPDIVALYIPENIIGNGFWIRVRNFERSFYDGTVIDAVRFIKRSTFLAIGGFDSRLNGPEDWDLDKRIRNLGAVGVANTYLSHNEGTFNLEFYLRKKSYYITNFDVYKSKWGNSDRDLRRQLGMFYRFFGVYIEKGKWLKILLHPLLTVGMYYLRFRVGMVYLKRDTAKA